MTSERNDAGGLQAPAPIGDAGPSGPADRLARWFLGRPAAVLVAAWCLATLAIWAPIYLTWPWYTDHDHFAMIAQSWSRGRVLYLDLFTNQFPGEIYLFRVLGECFGWGNTTAFYAADLAMVLLLGLLLVLWSSRRFGGALFGLVGFNAFLAWYSYQDITIAGQRDWHGAFLAVAGYLLLNLLPGRAGRVASGLALGLALSIRPQYVLAIPGMFLALGFRAHGTQGGWKGIFVAWVEWCLAVGAMVLVAFLPLILGGLIPEFVRDIRSIAYGAGLSPSLGLRAKRFAVNAKYYPEIVAVLIALGAAAIRAPRAIRPEAATVAALVLSMMFFGVLSPENHANYRIPIYAFHAVATALLAMLVIGGQRSPVVRASFLLALLALTGVAQPAREGLRTAYRVLRGTTEETVIVDPDPSYGTIRAIGYLAQGRMPDLRPSGRYEPGPRYPWRDYRAAMEYMRRTTTPDTPVVSLLGDSRTAFVGQIPRPMPMRTDAVAIDYFPQLAPGGARTLEETRGCVVVWDPGIDAGDRPALAPLCRVVRERYRPEARFGNIEVWRHSDAPPR